jgi:hypothetical protein
MGGRVAFLRGSLKIEAPAITGHPSFERGHLTHINTVENLIPFVPLLWIATYFYADRRRSGSVSYGWRAAFSMRGVIRRTTRSYAYRASNSVFWRWPRVR